MSEPRRIPHHRLRDWRWRRLAIGMVLAAVLPIGWLTVYGIASPADGMPANSVGFEFLVFAFVEHAALLGSFGYWLGLGEQRLKRAIEDRARTSLTDYLTELGNPRYFWWRAREEISRAKRDDEPVSLVMLEIDQLGDIQRLKGHGGRFMVLAGSARALNRGVRTYDVVARLRGDAFACLLPETGAAEAKHIAGRIRRKIRGSVAFGEDATQMFDLSVSLGVAATDAPPDAALPELCRAAERALRAVRKAGGDGIELTSV